MSILVAGNYCHDTLVSNEREHRTLGGSASYAASALAGLDEECTVLAKAGKDFLYSGEVLHAARIDGPRTTAFVDDYRSGERRQRVTAIGPSIRPDEIAGCFRIGIACGIAGEIGIATLASLRRACATVIADAQSVLREVTKAGEVLLRPLPPQAAALIDVLKADGAEAQLVDVGALRSRVILLVTEGRGGSRILTRDREVRVAAQNATEADPTGAGDCFLAGVAAGLSRGASIEEAVRLGAFCGARAVEVAGVPRPERFRGAPR